MPGSPRLAAATAAALLSPLLLPAAAPAQVTMEQVMNPVYQPRLKGGPGVNIDTPPESQWDKCEVKPVTGNTTGYEVVGPQGQMVRRLLDGNGDGAINLFIYYDQGLEVYREWDADGKKNGSQNDNFRWVNLGGTRWGVDTDGDLRIDEWKRISPQEAGRVAAEALINNDAEALATVLASETDLRSVGVDPAIVDDITGRLGDPERSLADLRDGSRMLSGRGRFQQVNVGQPGLILPGEQRSTRELEVVENSTALVSLPGRETGMISVGEMVRLPAGSRPGQTGDVWKLTALPQPIEGDGAQIVLGGPLMQPNVNATPPPDVSEAVAELLKELGALNANPPGADAEKSELSKFAGKRLDLYRKLFEADEGEDRGVWLRSEADELLAVYASEITTLEYVRDALKTNLNKAAADSPESLPYIEEKQVLVEAAARRRKLADENGGQIPQEKATELQQWFNGAREKFVQKYPDSEQAARFRLFLAIDAEQDGEKDRAADFYRTLAKKYPQEAIGRKAIGALRRLNLVGKPLEFEIPLLGGGTATEKTYAGKVLLLSFFTTDCVPCKDNLPILKDLRDRFGDDGFEILSVSLDASPNPLRGYQQTRRIDFPIGYEPGAFESPTAMRYGITTMPTMILADRAGRVVGTDLTIGDVQSKVQDLMK